MIQRRRPRRTKATTMTAGTTIQVWAPLFQRGPPGLARPADSLALGVPDSAASRRVRGNRRATPGDAGPRSRRATATGPGVTPPPAGATATRHAPERTTRSYGLRRLCTSSPSVRVLPPRGGTPPGGSPAKGYKVDTRCRRQRPRFSSAQRGSFRA